MLTVNTAVLLETQLTVRPLRALPLPSLGVAVSTCVAPTTIGVVGAERVTIVTGGGGAGLTVIELEPVLPSLVAVIVTGAPTLTPVTRPLPSTVATPLLFDNQVIMRPVRTTPAASLVTAESCCVPPTMMVAELGLTVTVATGTGLTVITGVADELTDSLVAVIVAVPTPAAVTVVVPLVELAGFTVSTAVLLETHVTVRPLSTLPAASRTVVVKG